MSYRGRARKDGNHPAIVKALRGVGATVADLADVGGGVPDIIVGWRGANVLMEIKDPAAVNKKDRELRPNQVEWHAGWKGQVTTVRSTDEALTAIGARMVIKGVNDG